MPDEPVTDVQPDLLGGGEHLLRRRAGLVGPGRGGTEQLGRELAHHVDEHGLVLGGSEVEDPA